MAYQIRRLDFNPPRFTAVKGGFPRKSAALAHLFDEAARLDMGLHYDFDDDANCVDIMMHGNGVAYQYEIRPEPTT